MTQQELQCAGFDGNPWMPIALVLLGIFSFWGMHTAYKAGKVEYEQKIKKEYRKLKAASAKWGYITGSIFTALYILVKGREIFIFALIGAPLALFGGIYMIILGISRGCF